MSRLNFGNFDPEQTDYIATLSGVAETTVEAETVQRRTRVTVDPVDSDADEANGHQVSLQGPSEITVTVTSADGSRTHVYRVAIQRPVVELAPGFNSVEWPGADGIPVADALKGSGVVVLYAWDKATGRWLAYFPGLEDVPGLNTLTALEQGHT